MRLVNEDRGKILYRGPSVVVVRHHLGVCGPGLDALFLLRLLWLHVLSDVSVNVGETIVAVGGADVRCWLEQIYDDEAATVG
ncbi:hypothetical protein RJ639_003871 [Escallonia herrerae]|uniref:Uncharacterized protein n=1 Tax=Escallonia herrerae TaxID=1293975 RepID=A0AA88W9R7_9ASTE|nr:hypothetical protein RJ639_003871 [Escallonia herrerae]